MYNLARRVLQLLGLAAGMSPPARFTVRTEGAVVETIGGQV